MAVVVTLVLLASLLFLPACQTPTGTAKPDAPEPTRPLRQACAGTNLDLAWIAESKACYAPKLPDTPFAGSWRLEPDVVEIRSGGGGQIDLVLANDTDRQQDVYVNVFCRLTAIATRIEDTQGVRRDVVERCGPGGGGCSAPMVRLSMDPHGTARVRIPVSATFRRQAEDCKLGAPSPLPPGEYRFIVDFQMGDPEGVFALKLLVR